jgi:hypothetical protein
MVLAPGMIFKFQYFIHYTGYKKVNESPYLCINISKDRKCSIQKWQRNKAGEKEFAKVKQILFVHTSVPKVIKLSMETSVYMCHIYTFLFVCEQCRSISVSKFFILLCYF